MIEKEYKMLNSPWIQTDQGLFGEGAISMG
jgi:hypothetical protein